LFAENVDTRAMLQVSVMLNGKHMVPSSKVRTWKTAGASTALFHNLEWRIHMQITVHIPANFTPNYHSLKACVEAVHSKIVARLSLFLLTN